MNHDTENKAANAAFIKTRDYFLGNSLKPSENVPDLLAENRRIAIDLAEQVMSLVDVIAMYFGIPTMDLAMAALPEVSLQLEADGIREKAAARTYLDLPDRNGHGGDEPPEDEQGDTVSDEAEENSETETGTPEEAPHGR